MTITPDFSVDHLNCVVHQRIQPSVSLHDTSLQKCIDICAGDVNCQSITHDNSKCVLHGPFQNSDQTYCWKKK